ncbi:MAG: hypothetical protein AB1899_07485 [Pseudomonadota bacterium]
MELEKTTPSAFLIAAMATCLAVVLVLLALPHDRYIRFQQIAAESVHYLRIKWIYERIHFDREPIDIAFIGTSHTQSGIDEARLESRLALNGSTAHVVNFAIPHLGRDIEFLVARELLENRPVKTLIIELQETESRAPHPGFQRLGSVTDILSAPLLINTDLFTTLSHLPLRELQLAYASLFPASAGLQSAFLQDHYEGHHWNDTYQLHGIPKPRTSHPDPAVFSRQVSQLRAEQQEKENLARHFDALPLGHNLLYRYNEIYLDKIVSLAHQHGAEVKFLYLPVFGATSPPRAYAHLGVAGELLDPRTPLRSEALWLNGDHLNYYGANTLTDWVADQLSTKPTSAGNNL